jgi:glycosyltransferase involved in cell wall biosynthesis
MSESAPAVSVIIPTYNRAHLLDRAIKSVLSQTYQDFEVIVVDDGSSDNTEDVIKSIGDARLLYVRHEKNVGSNAARNTGIRLARGKYISFQDSDDEWHPDKLERQVPVLEDNPDVGGVYSGFWRIKDGDRIYFPFPSRRPRNGHINESLLYGNFVTTQALLIRADVLRKTEGFDEKIPRLQDWELMLRLSKVCRFRFIDEPLFTAYYTNDSLSADNSKLIHALKLIMEKYREDFDRHPEAKASQYFAMGKCLCADRETNNARKYFLLALRTAPRVKYLLALIAVSTLGAQGFSASLRIYRTLRILMVRG